MPRCGLFPNPCAMLIPFRDKNPPERRPYVTYGLIAANIMVFLAYWPLFNDDRAVALFFFEWGLVPVVLLEGQQFFRLFSWMFLHGGIMHLAGNMLALFIYGDNLEDMFGHIKFLLFYLACGIGSAFVHAAFGGSTYIPAIGASGAIAGVMGGYLLLFPRARIDVFLFLVIYFRIIPVSAWIVLGVWMAFQVYGVSSPGDSNIAHLAHIGGFAVGLVFTLPAWIRLGGPKFWKDTRGHPTHPSSRYRRYSTVPKVRRSNRRR